MPCRLVVASCIQLSGATFWLEEEEVQEQGAEQSDLPKARSIWAVLQATFGFLDPRQRLSCQPRSPHCSPHSKMLAIMKASCQPGKPPAGADTEDHEQQIEVINLPTLCAVGLIPVGLLACNPLHLGVLWSCTSQTGSLFQGAVKPYIITACCYY